MEKLTFEMTENDTIACLGNNRISLANTVHILASGKPTTVCAVIAPNTDSSSQRWIEFENEIDCNPCDVRQAYVACKWVDNAGNVVPHACPRYEKSVTERAYVFLLTLT